MQGEVDLNRGGPHLSRVDAVGVEASQPLDL